MSLPSPSEKERATRLAKERVEYLCPICDRHVTISTGGFWCPVHGHIKPKIKKLDLNIMFDYV